jgi:hypothetical protein
MSAGKRQNRPSQIYLPKCSTTRAYFGEMGSWWGRWDLNPAPLVMSPETSVFSKLHVLLIATISGILPDQHGIRLSPSL